MNPDSQCGNDMSQPDRHGPTDARQRNGAGHLKKQDADHGNQRDVEHAAGLWCSVGNESARIHLRAAVAAS